MSGLFDKFSYVICTCIGITHAPVPNDSQDDGSMSRGSPSRRMSSHLYTFPLSPSFLGKHDADISWI